MAAEDRPTLPILHPSLFEEEIPLDLLCYLCNGVFRSPTLCKKGGHTFCSPCIISYLSTHSKCPIDDSPLSRHDLIPNALLDNMIISRLRLKTCPAKNHPFSKPVSALPRHLKAECAHIQADPHIFRPSPSRPRSAKLNADEKTDAKSTFSTSSFSSSSASPSSSLQPKGLRITPNTFALLFTTSFLLFFYIFESLQPLLHSLNFWVPFHAISVVLYIIVGGLFGHTIDLDASRFERYFLLTIFMVPFTVTIVLYRNISTWFSFLYWTSSFWYFSVKFWNLFYHAPETGAEPAAMDSFYFRLKLFVIGNILLYFLNTPLIYYWLPLTAAMQLVFMYLNHAFLDSSSFHFFTIQSPVRACVTSVAISFAMYFFPEDRSHNWIFYYWILLLSSLMYGISTRVEPRWKLLQTLFTLSPKFSSIYDLFDMDPIDQFNNLKELWILCVAIRIFLSYNPPKEYMIGSLLLIFAVKRLKKT